MASDFLLEFSKGAFDGAIIKDKRVPFIPRPAQREIYKIMDKHSHSVVIAHRRLGKTRGLVTRLVSKALSNKRRSAATPPRYRFVAPTERQGMDVSWAVLTDLASFIEGSEVRKSERQIILPNKASVGVLGAQNPDSLRGPYLDGLVIDEAAFVPLFLWRRILSPQLRDFGGWACFTSTPNGRNAFYKFWQEAQRSPNWGTAFLPVDVTKAISPEELKIIRERDQLTEAEFLQEFYCDFSAPVRGAYWGQTIVGLYKRERIGSFRYDPTLPVVTMWDIGYGDTTAIWFAQQMRDGTFLFFDFEQGHKLSAPQWAEIVKAKEYRFEMHILPHDAEAHDKGSGVDYQTFLYEAGLRNIRVAKRPANQRAKNTQIENTRQFIEAARFDERGCISGKNGESDYNMKDESGIDALSLYRSEFNEDKGIFSTKPCHDHYSHAADAMRTGATFLNPALKSGYKIGVGKSESVDPEELMRRNLDGDDALIPDIGGSNY